MKSGVGAFLLFVICSAFGTVESLATHNTLRCRLCNAATTLSDCVKMVTCDSTLEDCYMDEIITNAFTIGYNGGCRSKQVCSLTAGRKRFAPLAACSSDRQRCSLTKFECPRKCETCSSSKVCPCNLICCSFEDDCNKRLCGIRDDTLTASQCYSCDHRTSDQSEVRDPSRCITLSTCQPNEVCYATQSDIAGQDTFFYGCLSKLKCQFLMQLAFDDYKLCVVNATQPRPGLTWKQECGHVGRRSTSLCHSCCADSGCNYGACKTLNENMFQLAMAGKFDMKTLRRI